MSGGQSLLYITYSVDKQDSIAGSAHDWIAGLGSRFDRIDVICLKKGKYSLPPHVRVFSLGKEIGRWKSTQACIFYLRAFRSVRKVDFVFCQFSSIFVLSVLPIAILFRRPVFLWWTHKHCDWKLRLALKFSRKVLTATPETFPLKDEKVRCIGHGIDTQRFVPVTSAKMDGCFRVLTVGRVTALKKIEDVFYAMAELRRGNPEMEFVFEIVGGTCHRQDEEYLATLKALAHDLAIESRVIFHGSKPYSEIPKALQGADCFINTSEVGAVDKAVLEAMSTNLPVLTSNQAIREVMGPDLGGKWVIDIGKDNIRIIAEKLKELYLMSSEERATLGERMGEIIRAKWSIEHLCSGLWSEITGNSVLTPSPVLRG